MNAKLLKFNAPVEGQSTLDEAMIVGSLAEVVSAYPEAAFIRPRLKDGKMTIAGWSIKDKKGNSLFISLSKNLQKQWSDGLITPAQMGNCTVIAGQNAEGEDRFYLSNRPAAQFVKSDLWTEAFEEVGKTEDAGLTLAALVAMK